VRASNHARAPGGDGDNAAPPDGQRHTPRPSARVNERSLSLRAATFLRASRDCPSGASTVLRPNHANPRATHLGHSGAHAGAASRVGGAEHGAVAIGHARGAHDTVAQGADHRTPSRRRRTCAWKVVSVPTHSQPAHGDLNGCTPCCAFASSEPAMGAQGCHREGRGLVTHTAHSGSVRGRFQTPAPKDSITTAHGCHPYAF
jgi:hypothetical protein